MAKTKNEARTAWLEAEDEYRKVIAPFSDTKDTATMDKDTILAITKDRTKAERCLDAYVRRSLS